MNELLAGRYRIVERIGGGGMADVWRAVDGQDAREVAVKRLPAHLVGDPEARERFRREIDAASAVDHPLAVRALDARLTADDAWIVMELMPGGTLRDRLRAGPMAPGDAAQVGAQVASVLAVAHAGGLVHRDVTPANVLFDGAGRARLGDFGIARAGHDPLAGDVTAAEHVVGTLRFIAPEVLDGTPATPASDVWSLGALLYECVAGRPPFDAPSPSGLLAAHRDPAPSPGGDPALAGIIGSMLERDPHARPAASAVAGSLADLAGRLAGADDDATALVPLPGTAVWPRPAHDEAQEAEAAAPAMAGSPRPSVAASPPGGVHGAASPGVTGARVRPARRSTERRAPAMVALALLALAAAVVAAGPTTDAGRSVAAPTPSLATPAAPAATPDARPAAGTGQGGSGGGEDKGRDGEDRGKDDDKGKDGGDDKGKDHDDRGHGDDKGKGNGKGDDKGRDAGRGGGDG